LLMSAGMKFMAPPDFMKQFEGHLGFPAAMASPIGIVELLCTLLYIVPQTSVLGAILLTGYLGGATAAHVRLNEQFISPIILGVILWGGLWLRNPSLRALLPFKR
jgi:hypothetical protein